MRLVFVCAAVMMVPAAAAAQTAAEPGRVYVAGVGGVAVSDQHAPLIAGQVGVRLARGFYVTGEAGLIGDVLPQTLRDEVDVVGRLLTLEGGSETTFDARLRSRYVAGGVRWIQPVHALGVFAEGHVGASFLHVSIDSSGAAGEADELETELRHDHPDASSGTRLMGMVGGGVTVPLAVRWRVDAGYRYSWIMTDPAIHVHIPYAAVRVEF